MDERPGAHWSQGFGRRAGKALAGIGALLLAAILISSYRQGRAAAERLWALRLDSAAAEGAAAAGKILERWQADANRLAAPALFVNFLSADLRSAASHREAAGAFLDIPRQGYGYVGALLLNHRGEVLLSRPEKDFPARWMQQIREAATSGRQWVFLAGPPGESRVACLAPVAAARVGGARSTQVGTAVLLADPEKDLCPAIWSSAYLSPPVGTALAVVEGGAAMLLGCAGPPANDGPPLVSASGEGLRLVVPSNQALEKWKGPTLAVGRPIEGTPWSCVAFVGRNEVFREAGRRLMPMAALVFSIYGSMVFFGYLLLYRREMEYLRGQREIQRRHEALLAHLPGIAFRCANDPSWTMQYLSPGCRDLTGYTPEDLLGNAKLSFADLIHPEDRQRVWEEVQAALSRNDRYTLVYRIRTRDGRLRHVWEQGSGVVGPRGRLDAVEGFITDVTDRVELKKTPPKG